jgi:crotonobetainyl-CoA:carnitine CoA-transferase CaiB-like acyl-CoA transferase
MAGLLDGIRVLDFTQVVAGPVCTRMMAELGAEVIKVELAPLGDHARQLPVLRNGRSAYFCQHNLGKKSLCLDLKRPEAAALLRGLVDKVDVLVENFAPGAIDRLGFGWDTVRRINPRLIMCSISAFGQTGPLRELPGFDYVAQAVAGVTSMTGDPAGPPAVVGLALGDVATGTSALAAINAALFRRERSGEGRYLDISLVDVYFHSHELNVQIASLGDWKPTRSGSQHGAVTPIGIFPTRTGYIYLVVLEPMWDRLCAAMGRPDLKTDARYATNAARMANKDAVIALIQAWLDSFDGRDAALARLAEARVPAAPVLTVEEAMRHPHMVERGAIRTIDDPLVGRFAVPATPLRFAAEHEPDTAPFLGEHNAEILSDQLGLTAARIAELNRLGVLHAEALPR